MLRIDSIWATLVSPPATVTMNQPFLTSIERKKILNDIDGCLKITTKSCGLARLSLEGVANTVRSIDVLLDATATTDAVRNFRCHHHCESKVGDEKGPLSSFIFQLNL